MANQENFITPTANEHPQDERVEQETRLIEGDTYPISDNESTPDSGNLIDANAVRSQGDFNDSMSQDSLTHGEPDEQNHLKLKRERPPSSTTTTNSKFSSKMSTMKSTSNGTALRSLALDEHIKLVKQKKEEAEVLRLQKFQEQLRKKEQKWQQQQLERVKKWLQLRNRDIDHRTQVEERRRKREEEAKVKVEELLRREKEREQRVQQHRATKPEGMMTMSTDAAPSRRAISASRLRSHHQDRRLGTESSDENSHVSKPKRQMPSSASSYWLSTGEATSAHFMRSTYAAKCRHEPTDERCPRDVRAPDEPVLSNGHPQRRNINETMRRLAKPKNPTVGASAAKTLPISRSSHQIRLTTASVTTNRRQPSSRPATVPTSISHSRTSPSDDPAPKPPSISKKPPTRSKPLMTRSLMITSHSSSSLSSASKSRPPTKSEDEREQTPPVIEEISPPLEPIHPPKPPPIVDEQEYQRKLNQKIREVQQRLEVERQREEERLRQLELEEFEREQEQIRLVEEQRRAEQERLERAIEEREREDEVKRQEEQRLQQQREEFERKQVEETERLNRERQEKAKKEEEERVERKRRLDLIMRRTRQVSPTPKEAHPPSKSIAEESNGHEQPIATSPKSSIPHSISDNRFPTSASTENFLLTNSVAAPATEAPKFKSPLIQSLLNKARNTRSTDNLIQTSLTASQIITESIIDEAMTKSTDLSQENGHNDLHLTASYHERPIEAATAFQ